MVYTIFESSISLFLISIWGLIALSRNLILLLMSIEMMFLAITILFINSSIYLDDISGQIYALFLLTVSAAESAIGFALIICYYRLRGVLILSSLNNLKG